MGNLSLFNTGHRVKMDVPIGHASVIVETRSQSVVTICVPEQHQVVDAGARPTKQETNMEC